MFKVNFFGLKFQNIQYVIAGFPGVVSSGYTSFRNEELEFREVPFHDINLELVNVLRALLRNSSYRTLNYPIHTPTIDHILINIHNEIRSEADYQTVSYFDSAIASIDFDNFF